MNSLPLDLQTKKKILPSETQDQTQPSRGPVAPPNHMAATLSRSIPSYSLPPPNSEFRPQLPPLLPPINQSYQPSNIHSRPGPSSPASATSSTQSWVQPAYSHPFSRSQPPTINSQTSPKQAPRLNGTEDPFSRHDSPIQGIKRPFEIMRQPGRSPRQVDASVLSPRSFQGPPRIQTSVPSNSSVNTAEPTTLTGSMSQSTIPRERFSLHLRQQPRAARAGPDGKDRRTIDPPPVLQVLINDFDLDNDISYLKAHDWVVHASLISAQAPHQDMNTVRTPGEGPSNKKITRLLLGTTVSSPFFCPDDPDREHAPAHPTTKVSPPPSPTMRFIKKSSKIPEKSNKDPEAHKKYPGAYFIFADLSVRKAGQYRLEFRLMKMEEHLLTPGSSVPTLSVVVSDVFNVVNAKDFDQVQPSTNLVKGLLDRGAGFPLKLKKGLREGQRRRNRASDSEDDGEGDGEDRDDALDDDNDEDES